MKPMGWVHWLLAQLQFQTPRHEDSVSIAEMHFLQALDSFQRQCEDIRQFWTFGLIAKLICGKDALQRPLVCLSTDYFIIIAVSF
jgi:hypothetical protein